MADVVASPVFPDQILSTKFVIPTGPAQLVARPRLQPREQAPRIVLVCAPAGYGKTTLVAGWAAASAAPVAWLSLDAGDNDPLRFLMHFIHAIQGRFAEFGKVMVDMFAATPPPPIGGLMRSLVNQLCALPERLCLILDDLHVVTEPALHEAIAFLVDHQPPQLQLIVASRNDPPFSLARLRGQGHMVEYRTEDLRFTLQEAEAFCNEVMQFSLPREQVSTLAARTEGWIVGLQLAAVSLNNTPNKAGFIEHFAGDNRHITDFLLDEVLRSRSDDIQNFLLQTSVLERFNAPLCDALTGRDDSSARIQELEQANMFIFGLDHQRVWYRYHHLFASLLQSRLRATVPDSIKLLHRRASQWFSENDFITEAIDHALKAGDYAFALDLMERHRTTLFSHGQINTALAWARLVPEELVAKRPLLAMTCAWANFYMDNSVGMQSNIRSVELCLADFRDAPFGSKERAILGQVALIRGCHAGYNGDLDGGTAYLLEARASFVAGRLLHRVAGTCLGVAYFNRGRLDEAQRLFEENHVIAEAKLDVLAPVAATLGLGRVMLMRGRCLAARQILERAIQEGMQAGWQDFPACGMLHAGLGEVAYEMNELALAEQHLLRAVEMMAAGMQYFNAWARLLLIRTRLAAGASDARLDAQHEAAITRYMERAIFDLPPVSATLGRMWLSQGRMDALTLWSEATRLPLGAALAIGREPEYLVLARFFLASERFGEATVLLNRLWPEAEQGNRLAVMIEILILTALARQGEGNSDDALAVLQQAVTLAEKTSLLRVFINEGHALAGLLKKLARGADYKSYAHTLLGHFDAGASPAATPGLAALFSKKEIQVVGYIVKGMANRDIADALFISLNTLNSHMKKIYAKLGATSRLQAIERLRQLGLHANQG